MWSTGGGHSGTTPLVGQVPDSRFSREVMRWDERFPALGFIGSELAAVRTFEQLVTGDEMNI